MTITLYRISDDRIVVDKNTSNSTKLGDLNAHYKEDTDFLNPVLELAYDATYYAGANYIYISEWQRYYYIVGKKTGMQRMFFTCEIDPLKSFKSGIKNLTCIVERQERRNKCDMYLQDSAFKAQVRKIISTRYFPKSFSKTPSIILTTGGKS